MAKKIIMFFLIGALVNGALIYSFFHVTKAEQSGSSPESGVDSRIKTIYDALFTKNQSSDANGTWGNWSKYWNRIRTATLLLPHGCQYQRYHDSDTVDLPHPDETTNCSLTWTANPTPATGDDARAGRGGLDPRSGLTWSQLLKNNAGTVEFNATTNSTWNWDGTLAFTVTAATAAAGDTYTNNGQTFTVGYTIASSSTLYAKPASSGLPAASGDLTKVTGAGTDPIHFSVYTLYGSNVAVGGKSASELCTERGSGWRLPTHKELMQAYIDGSYWNLSQTSSFFWSATENNSTNAWNVYLNYGYTDIYNKSTSNFQVRCVR